MMTVKEERVPTYQIGTVSSLTGIDAHTLRAWERRYGAIEPNRSDTGRRLYDDHTVERLQLLKALVDCNEAIGQIAGLSDDALRARLARIAEHEAQTSAAPDPGEEGRPARVALLSDSLASQISANTAAFAGLDLHVCSDDVAAFVAAAGKDRWDVVILELGLDRSRSVDDATLEALGELPGRPGVLVIYRFATNATLAKASRAGAIAARAPIRSGSLRRVVDDLIVIRRARRQSHVPRPVHARRSEPTAVPVADVDRIFDDGQLARLLEISGAIDCECPNHLSSLVTGLVDFERYSRACESRDSRDAEQHRRLAEGTAQARALMEKLLVGLCEHEGIVV